MSVRLYRAQGDLIYICVSDNTCELKDNGGGEEVLYLCVVSIA